MPRYALKVAYDGTRFQGSQRQPDARTVEGDLLRILTRLRAITSAEDSRFLTASRTDAGVSAAGNVYALTTPMPLPRVVASLNEHLRDAWVVGAVQVDDTFHPRASKRRQYRYHLRRGGYDEDALSDALACFSGTHDFTGFARVEGDTAPVRTLDQVTVLEAGPFLNIEFTAPNFLWNQVRRMVGAGLTVARGEATVADLEAVLQRESDRFLGIAPPEPLVLLDVAYDFPIPVDPQAAARLLQPRLDALDLQRAIIHDFAHGGLP